MRADDNVGEAMGDSKWISGLSPTMCAVDAARKVLSVRLRAVEHYLPLAAKHPEEDIEYVHQLRVSTRRASAAVDVFTDFVTRKARKAVRKRLREIRRAAGAARDADVSLQFLVAELQNGPPHRHCVLDFLVGLMLERRTIAQQNLRATAEEGLSSTFLLASVGEPSNFDVPRRFGPLAAAIINPLLRAFDQAVADETEDRHALHAIRIRGKELRYAMEIFSPCFAPDFRETLYPLVEEAQEILGEFNDDLVLQQRLSELLSDIRLLPEIWRERLAFGMTELASEAEKRVIDRLASYRSWSRRWLQARQSVPTWTPQLT